MESSLNYEKIKSCLSAARLSSYEKLARNDEEVLSLYVWNLKISSSLMACLSLCEVVVRNAVSKALEQEYGKDRIVNERFNRSIIKPRRMDLEKALGRKNNTDQVIPELPFVFWQSLFTKRFDNFWVDKIDQVFPYVGTKDYQKLRLSIYQDLEDLRKIRNRIAHHEPIFHQDLLAEYQKILRIIGYCCQDTVVWIESWQTFTEVLQSKSK